MIKNLLTKTMMLSAILMGTAAMTQAPADARLNPIQNESKTRVQNAVLDFTLVNATGYDIEAIYIGPYEQESWGDNLLEDTFADGDSIPWTFSPEAEATHWDLRVDWADEEEGTFVYWRNLDLSQISSMTLHYDHETEKTSATFNDAE